MSNKEDYETGKKMQMDWEKEKRENARKDLNVKRVRVGLCRISLIRLTTGSM